MLLDFDGTLSPIVADPQTARALPGVVETLGRLSARYHLVAVVSGRPGWFLATHIDVPGVERWGSYGSERVTDDGRVVVADAAEAWRPVVADAVARARRTAPPGVGVEDKGVSLTLHVRGAPSQESWVRAFARTEAASNGFQVHDAKMSVELRPPSDVDKGTVVGRLAQGLDAACFVGDDIGDLAAFRALDAVPVAVRVAVRSDESPPDLLAAADLIVDGPAGTLAFLRTLLPSA